MFRVGLILASPQRRPMKQVDTLGIEPRASRMLSGCDTTTPCAQLSMILKSMTNKHNVQLDFPEMAF